MIFRKKFKTKPISLNECWQLKGWRKFKSKKYKLFQDDIALQLRETDWPYKSRDLELEAIYRFGFSNRAADLDNAVKPIQDTLSDLYSWNDSKMYGFKASKIIVPKGKEFINVSIYTREMSCMSKQ